MRYRLGAFGVHLLGSAALLSLVLGGLYLGWYRWPGWYLAGAAHIAALLVGVDVALGPLMTLVIANPAKPRRELARDIGIIVAVQLVALVYGSATLWRGRPLYYAFSVDRLQLVQAADMPATEIALGRQENPGLAPTWHSLPRWVWAPLPNDEKVRQKIMTSSIFGGVDVIQMPRYFKPWGEGLPELRKRLEKVDDLEVFTQTERQALDRKMMRLGLAPNEPVATFLTGRNRPVLVIFDRDTMRIKAILPAD